MSQPEPIARMAAQRETGVPCPHCSAGIAEGETILDCPRCGAVQHADCWYDQGGCGAYECAPARRALGAEATPAIRITQSDLDQVVPLPGPKPAAPAVFVPPARPVKEGTSRLAVAALVVALAGIPLFGAVTGLVAILLGALALGAIHQSRQRGTALALAGVLVGVADVAGWVVFLAVMLSRGGPQVTLADFEPDMTALENLPAHINRAMRANVLVEAHHGWKALGATGIGSGVIVRIEDDSAVIVTNRHVIDEEFADSGAASDDLPHVDYLGVKLIGQPMQPARVLWVAPDGIDLAVISVPVYTDEVQAATWQSSPRLALGDAVFSIGNPQRLGWTHTGGTISQIRFQRRGGRKVSIIQTDTAINPGNSGGGLYDHQGRLIGINTWTNDKRFSEGLSFALAFHSLLDLDPPFPKTPAGGDGEGKP